MDKILMSILEEEQCQINELMELNRRTIAAEAKLNRLFMLLEEGNNDVLQRIERAKEEVAGMKEMQIEYQQELDSIRKDIIDCARDMLNAKNFKYLPPVKRTDITEEEAIKLAIDGNKERKNRQRASEGVTIRKGRVIYGKINKIQD